MRRNSTRVQGGKALQLEEQNEIDILNGKWCFQIGEIGERIALLNGFADRGKRLFLERLSPQLRSGLHWISTMIAAEDAGGCDV